MPDCSSIADEGGAHVRARTGDLFLTKEVLCLLSYVGPHRAMAVSQDRPILGNHRPISANLGLSLRFAGVGVRSFRWKAVVGREGIEPPQSKDG